MGMTQDQIDRAARQRGEAAKQRLGIRRGNVLLFRDGMWICDPRDRDRPDLKIGSGSTADEAVEDCATVNNIN